MSVRVATATDEAIIAALRFEWSVEDSRDALTDNDFAASFHEWFVRESEHRVTWLACAGDDPVGMLNMLVFTRMPRPGIANVRSQWGYVANIFVLKSHRDEGWGTRMVDACIAHASEHNFARLVLSPSERSIPMYQRAGFSPATSLMIRLID